MHNCDVCFPFFEMMHHIQPVYCFISCYLPSMPHWPLHEKKPLVGPITIVGKLLTFSFA